MKISEIYYEYQRLKKPIVTFRTYKSLVSAYDVHIKPHFSDKEFSQLKYIDYQNFANNLLLKELKPKTVKNILNYLSSIINFAIKNEWYDGKNYTLDVEIPKYDNKQYFTLDVEVQKAYIKAILDNRVFFTNHIFIFLLHGRRLEEVLSLKWEQIDLNSGVMYIPAKLNKSRKNLSFELTDIQIRILKIHYAICYDRQCSPLLQGYVFVNPYTLDRYRTIKNAWFRLLDTVGLPRIRIHDIRHLVATYLINELKMSIEIVSHLLGHSDIKITQQYINPKPANAKIAMNKLLNSVVNISALGNRPL